MRLTIGMATHTDFDGVYFTAQALKIYHAGLVDELVVVDNAPMSTISEALRHYCGGVGAVYIPFPAPTGTAAPRNEVFTRATGDVVLCVDAHVLLFPGAVKAVRDYFTANPDSADLVQGPLVMDNLQSFNTHFNDGWRAQMRGMWGLAWRCPCGTTAFSTVEENGTAAAVRLVEQTPIDSCPACGASCRVPQWVLHEKKLIARGCVPAVAGGKPFEIPGQGLGVFGCRKAAWLGFNPKFRGFGGEEMYVHEKYKRVGHKTVCLPQLQWNHRFGRPGGAPYPLTAYQKVRNYVIGHRENGRDVGDIYRHFVEDQKAITPQMWEAVLREDESPPTSQSQPSGCGGCNGIAPRPVLDLNEWYKSAAESPSDINEHVPSLRSLAEGCDQVVEFGVRTGVSTAGLLAGRPKRFLSVDINDSPHAKNLEPSAKAAGVEFTFLKGNSLTVGIPECDLLFIDTKHTAEQVYAELTRHAPQVRKRIAFHDTEIFGETGEDGSPGLLPGIRRFLKEHSEWTTIRHAQNNHGFTVISRDPGDKKPLPSLWKQAWNFARATAKDLVNGQRRVSLPVAESRLAECLMCDQHTDGRCAKCGCYLNELPTGDPGKVWYATEVCPLGKWHADESAKELEVTT